MKIIINITAGIKDEVITPADFDAINREDIDKFLADFKNLLNKLMDKWLPPGATYERKTITIEATRD